MTLIPFTPKTTGTSNLKGGMIPFTPGQQSNTQSIPKVNNSYGDKVGQEQLAGINKIKGSVIQGAKDLGKPDSLSKLKGVAEGAFGSIVGAGQALLAPITPAITPIVSGIVKTITPALRQANPDLAKAYDFVAPKVDELAKKHPESATLISDIINTALYAIPGGKALSKIEAPVKEALSKEALASTGEKIIGTVSKGAEALGNKIEGTTPAKLDDFIDKKYSKAIPMSSKKSITLTENQLANNRESMKLIADNKANLEFSNQAGTYDKARLPENIGEHAQAVTKTKQDVWGKMTNLLKEKNVSISLDKPLSALQAKIKQLGESASETPYLKSLYEKYSKTPMATVDQYNTFIKDLNNDAEPYFQSGSDKAKATASASFGNLLRDNLDTTAQQIGTPEVSLLRKQYGALVSTEKDIARAVNKQLKGAGGGASGLADLFSGEEIARGVITGNPSSIVSGLSLQATKKFLKFLGDPNRAVKNLYTKIEEVSSQGEVPRMKSSFDVKERAGLPVVKGNLNTAKTPEVINLPGKIGGFDEAQSKVIGGLKSSEGLTNYIKKEGGVTIDSNGNMLKEGFSVSPSKTTETKIPIKDFKSSDIDAFRKKYAKQLSQNGNHFGAWNDGKNIVLDVSNVNSTLEEAIATAKKSRQDAIYNLKTGETIYKKDFNKLSGTVKKASTGQQNAEFFTGKAKEASSKIPYTKTIDTPQVSSSTKKAFDKYTMGGNFTGHISKMIPAFAEKQLATTEAIIKSDSKSFLDIGASEGGVGKTISSQNPNIHTVSLDPNPTMYENFKKTPAVKNAEYKLEALGASWTEPDGTVIKEFKPTQKFDAINEDFAFQFINNDREGQVKMVKSMMSKDGIFTTSEKFHTKNRIANEQAKYAHQEKYFSEDQLTEDKQTIVTGMSKDQVKDFEYEKILAKNFSNVAEYWNSGNFKGYVATDNLSKFNKFLKDVGNVNSDFSEYKTPRIIKSNQLKGKLK